MLWPRLVIIEYSQGYWGYILGKCLMNEHVKKWKELKITFTNNCLPIKSQDVINTKNYNLDNIFITSLALN